MPISKKLCLQLKVTPAARHRFAPAQRRHVHSLVPKTADTHTRPTLRGPMLYRLRYLHINVHPAIIPKHVYETVMLVRERYEKMHEAA